ncbi:MAG TPA: DEAD/DEAH box helicase, partial [Blastocatellia bacterium]|nr:DEAD/DEAH box helicase [Blastocatellia bacterium]
MIILHAGWLQQQLLLWGETPAEATQQIPKKTARPQGGKSTAKRAAPYPYQADQASLLGALGTVFSGLKLAPDDTTTIALWLPTIAGQPLASSPLIAEPPLSATPPALTKWTVTALPLRMAEALDLLGLCVGHTTLAPGILVGSDLAYWATALRWAGTLLARQQMLPSVQETAGVWQAIWEPVMAGADLSRLTKLAQAMPHVGRACTTAEATAPPTVPALSCVTAFIREMMNALVRATAAPTPLPTKTKKKKAATFDSLHDQWLHALRHGDATLQGSQSELQTFAAQVQEWQRPLTVMTTAPFRLCFRLEEPVEPDADAKPRRRAAVSSAWYVRYLLQAADDPSLLVPVQEAWQPKAKTAAVLQRGAFTPREYLLATLGQAAGLSPNIEQSLKTATPSGYELNATGAHQFLTEHAWLLEQAGFGVMLPAWWSRKGTKLSLTARARVTSPKFQGSGGLSLSEVVQFDWELALGDQTLTRKELEALAQLKAPLVKVRGQWVQLNADEIQAALDFWKKHPSGQAAGQATVRELVKMSLGVGATPGGVALAGVQATGWIGDFLAQLSGTKNFAQLPTPEQFQGTLRPYQTRGFSWLAFLRQWGLGACLADDMGLGKTVQTLALLERDWQQNGKRPVLLVCPMSVVGNWQKEAARFTPDLPVLIHHGLGRSKDATFKKQANQQALVISSYSLLHRDQHLFADIHWAGVILDEAQNIKNAETKQARAARALKSDYRIALTGTPVENNVGDLWSILEFLNPGFLGTPAEFRRNFFLPIQAQRDEEATAKLKRLTTPFILRRVKTDKAIISDLPDKIEMKVFCTLTKEQASLYAAVVADMSRELNDAEGIKRKGLVLATLTKLKQVCNHPAHLLGDNSALPGRSGKLARLTEMLEEALATGDRALIFTQFAEMGTMVRQHLQETFGQEVLFLHGAVPQKKREQMVERFQQANGPSLFILSLKAGGTGLNLTAANHVFHFDRWWNPAVENQATDRAFRIGQQRNVQVHKFLCVGTLEEKIDEMIERKQTIASSIVGTGEGW